MPDIEIPAAYRQAADAIRKYGATAEAAAELLRRCADEIESARGAAESPATPSLMAAIAEGEAEIAGWAVEPPALARPPSWWHAYGAVPTKGEHAGCWVQIIVGPGGLSPDGRTRRPIPLGSSGVMLPYLRSWDHEPTDEETAALHPAPHRTSVVEESQ